MNEQINKFNNDVIAKAIKQVDADSLAKKLAKVIESECEDQIQEVANNIDFSYWIQEELTNPKTAAGKQFEKSMKAITKRMAESILGD